MSRQWPSITAQITDTGIVTLTIAGISRTRHASSLELARETVRAEVSRWARHLGRSLRTHVTDPDGTWHLTIDGDATTTSEQPTGQRKRRKR